MERPYAESIQVITRFGRPRLPSAGRQLATGGEPDARHSSARPGSALVLRRSRFSLLLMAAVCAGCPGDMNGDPDPTTMLTAEIGQTDEATAAYTALAEGGDLTLFAGTQGGRHVFITIRATGFSLGASGHADVRLEQFVTRVGDDRVLSSATQTVPFAQISDGVVELRSWFIVLDAPPDELEDAEISLTFTLTDPTDTSRSVEVSRKGRLRI